MKKALSLTLVISTALFVGLAFIHCSGDDEPTDPCPTKECCTGKDCITAGETCSAEGTCIADPCPTKECCVGKACPTDELCSAEGVCEAAPVCCDGQALWADVTGDIVSFGPGSTGVPVAFALVGGLDAMTSATPTKLTTGTSDSTGHYESECVDLTLVATALLVHSDDDPMDGTAGNWFPTYSGVADLATAAGKTCVPDAADAWAVPNTLVASLTALPGMEDIVTNGFAILFVVDSTYQPVAGADLKKADGTDLPATVKTIYPSADFSDFTGQKTSANGVILVPGSVSLMSVKPVKEGMAWEAGMFATVRGYCFTRPYVAD